jgi:hypothetical protein
VRIPLAGYQIRQLGDRRAVVQQRRFLR